MTDQQPAAIYFAEHMEGFADPDAQAIGKELRRQHARIAELEAQVLELDRLCDETYVQKGADAYHHACSEMERFQEKRRKAKKEVGTTHSLCDGMDWVYGKLDDLEAQLEAVGEGGVQRLSLNEHEIIAAFMQRTGQYVTNDASRADEIAQALQQSAEDARDAARYRSLRELVGPTKTGKLYIYASSREDVRDCMQDLMAKLDIYIDAAIAAQAAKGDA